MDAVGSLLFEICIMGFVNLLILPWHIFNWLSLDTLKGKNECALTFIGISQQFLFVDDCADHRVGCWWPLQSDRFLRRTVYGLEQFNGRIGRFASLVCSVDDDATGFDYCRWTEYFEATSCIFLLWVSIWSKKNCNGFRVN